MKLIILSTVLLFTTAACSMSRKAELNQSVKTESSVSEDTSYRFIVSFISIGSGIDKKAKNHYEEFLNDFQLKHNVTILYEKKYWGREGEVNFCFMLNELNKEDQEKFILESKNLLSNSTRVRFKESNSQEPKN
jgi:hypothetical protein